MIILNDEVKSKLIPEAYWEDEEGNSVTELDYVDYVYDTVGGKISQELRDSLNGANAHSLFKIWDYVDGTQDKSEHPKALLFPEQLDNSLFKQTVIAQGERKTSTYYGSYDLNTNTYSEPVILIEYEYFRNDSGYAEYRTRTISWYMQDGSIHPTKKTHYKYFTSLYAQQSELTNRRKNLITEAKSLAEAIGLREAIAGLFSKYNLEILEYAESGSPVFRDAIIADTEFTWLNSPTQNPDVTIRQFLAGMFSIGLLS